MDSSNSSNPLNEQGNFVKTTSTSEDNTASFTTVTTTTTVAPPAATDAKASKPPKVRGHICLYFFMILVRFYCAIAGFAELGYGGWIFYNTATVVVPTKVPLDIVAGIATGGFLLIAGLAILFAELRTRWTAQRSVKVFVFLGSWVGRGLFYLAIALLNLPIQVEVYNLKLVQGKEFAAVVGLAGLLSLIMHPFFWHLERIREQARQTWIAEQLLAGVELDSIIINPGENNDGHTMFDPKLAKLAPVAPEA